jgi:hypothetical protein
MNLLVQKHGFHLYANKLQSDKDSYRKRKQSYLHRNQENKYMLRIKLAKWERNRTAEQRTIAPHKHILPALCRIAKNDPKVLLYVKGMSDDIFLIIPTTFRIRFSSSYETIKLGSSPKAHAIWLDWRTYIMEILQRGVLLIGEASTLRN